MGHSLPCCAPADKAQRTRATVKTLPVNVRQTLLMVVSPPWWYRIASNRPRAPNALDRARRPVKGNPLSFRPAFNAEFGRPPADPASLPRSLWPAAPGDLSPCRSSSGQLTVSNSCGQVTYQQQGDPISNRGTLSASEVRPANEVVAEQLRRRPAEDDATRLHHVAA